MIYPKLELFLPDLFNIGAFFLGLPISGAIPPYLPILELFLSDLPIWELFLHNLPILELFLPEFPNSGAISHRSELPF